MSKARVRLCCWFIWNGAFSCGFHAGTGKKPERSRLCPRDPRSQGGGSPQRSWVLGSLAEQEASAQHAGDAADGQRDSGAAHQAGSRPRRGAGGGVGRQGACVQRVYAGCRDAVEEARVGGATEHQQAARFQQQRGGRPRWGPGLRGGLKVSGSPEVGGGGRREISRFGGSGARVSESQGQRLRGKCAPKDRGFGMKIIPGPGPGGEGWRGGKGEWSAVFGEGVGTRLQMGGVCVSKESARSWD